MLYACPGGVITPSLLTEETPQPGLSVRLRDFSASLAQRFGKSELLLCLVFLLSLPLLNPWMRGDGAGHYALNGERHRSWVKPTPKNVTTLAYVRGSRLESLDDWLYRRGGQRYLYSKASESLIYGARCVK